MNDEDERPANPISARLRSQRLFIEYVQETTGTRRVQQVLTAA